MRVVLDRDRCAGHGRCYVLAPEVFGVDDEGHGVVKVTDVAGQHEEQARIGEQSCPERAIRILD